MVFRQCACELENLITHFTRVTLVMKSEVGSKNNRIFQKLCHIFYNCKFFIKPYLLDLRHACDRCVSNDSFSSHTHDHIRNRRIYFFATDQFLLLRFYHKIVFLICKLCKQAEHHLHLPKM